VAILVSVRSGQTGNLPAFMPGTPSWFQWPLLEAAMKAHRADSRSAKSFNCSYLGHDLWARAMRSFCRALRKGKHDAPPSGRRCASEATRALGERAAQRLGPLACHREIDADVQRLRTRNPRHQQSVYDVERFA